MNESTAPLGLPVPGKVHTPAELGEALNMLRRGQSYGELDKAARRLLPEQGGPRRLPSSTLGDLLKGRTSQQTLETFLAACGLPKTEALTWVRVWKRIRTVNSDRPNGEIGAIETNPEHLSLRMSILKPPLGRLPSQVRGRDQIVSELTALAASADGKFQVIAGMGGVGKSTVALLVAEQAIVSGHPLWWISAASGSVSPDLLSLAKELGAPVTDIQNALNGQTDPSDVLWSRLERARGWTIVIDNADDVTSLAVSGRSARDGNGWLRGSLKGTILVTSRDSDPASWGAHAHVHTLEPLSDDDGAEMLMDLAPGAGEANAARRVSSQLGGLPLALQQAGHHLSVPFVEERTFDQYLASLPSSFAGLTRGPVGRTADARETVMATWDISLRTLEDRGVEHVRDLMTTLAFFAAPSPIPMSVLQIGTREGVLPDTTLSAELPALRSTGLIVTAELIRATTVAPALVAVHPVVAKAFRHSASDEAETRAVQTLIDCLESTVGALDRHNPDTWPAWRMLVPHLAELLDHPNPEQFGMQTLNELTHVCARVVSTLAISSDHPYAREITQRLERYTQLFSEQHIVNITARYTIAHLRRTNSQSTEGEQDFRQILELQRRLLGDEHFDTLHTRHNLAHTLAGTGRLNEAVREFRETIRLREQTLGRTHDNTISSRQALTFHLIKNRRTDEARRELAAIQQHTDASHLSDHPLSLFVRHSLARIGLIERDTVGLMATLHEILADRAEMYGDSHLSTEETRASIAELHEIEGNPQQALKILKAILERQSNRLGAKHAFNKRIAERVATLVDQVKPENEN
ncbi:tetratricopeptide repeat protein [Nocardiopsis sp. LOL_012]|uniref:tetratricopeptide repeat protein n=1 Tax=Nocardiopsis sp. LOL_012 TaxID=3345409 RepID=UPI003A874D20